MGEQYIRYCTYTWLLWRTQNNLKTCYILEQIEVQFHLIKEWSDTSNEDEVYAVTENKTT